MKRALREEARNLRRQGLSSNDIVRVTGASKGSVSVWVRDIVLTKEQKDRQRYYGQAIGAQANREKHLKLRQDYQETGREKAREGRPVHLAGCMLYWAEGSKSH